MHMCDADDSRLLYIEARVGKLEQLSGLRAALVVLSCGSLLHTHAWMMLLAETS